MPDISQCSTGRKIIMKSGSSEGSANSSYISRSKITNRMLYFKGVGKKIEAYIYGTFIWGYHKSSYRRRYDQNIQQAWNEAKENYLGLSWQTADAMMGFFGRKELYSESCAALIQGDKVKLRFDLKNFPEGFPLKLSRVKTVFFQIVHLFSQIFRS